MEIKQAKFIMSEVTLDKLPKDNLIEIALAGRSNVGKSSFINSISNNNHLARTSKTPGKTVTLNYYLINNSFYFVDLPGYGYAKRNFNNLESFDSITDMYITQRDELKLVIVFVDSRVITDDDKEMVSFLKEKGIPFIVIMSKVDKLKKNDYIKRKRETLKELVIEEDNLILYSSLTLYGKENILKILEKYLF